MDRHIACPFSMGDIMSMRYEAPEQQRAFYKSKTWQRCRAAYISKVGGLCERCFARGIVRPGYIVHHKEYISLDNINDPAVLLNHDNLEYLCMDCHNNEHFANQKRYIVRESGEIVAVDSPHVTK